MDDPNDPDNVEQRRETRRLHNVRAPPTATPGRVRAPVPLRGPSGVPVPGAGVIPGTGVPGSSGGRSGYRRAPSLRYVPTGSAYDAPYGDPFGGYPYGRSYVNHRGLADPYGSPYNSYGHPGQYNNPVIAAAAENSQPVFESIQAVVHSFNSISMLLESTFTATHMSFEALLGVAENFTRLRMFMTKLYSAIMTFKLARWFLNKLLFLIKKVRRPSGSSVEEDLWRSLASGPQREFIPPAYDGHSWPLIMFTGLLFATPYLVYKILNSETSVVNPARESIENILPTANADTPSRAQHLSEWNLVVKSKVDWNSQNPKTLPTTKGNHYWTSNNKFLAADSNGGWLYVSDQQGRRGFAPVSIFRLLNTNSTSVLPGIVTEISVPTTWEQNSQLPTRNEHDNQLGIPHLSGCELVLEEDIK